MYFSILELLILLCVKRQQVNKHCHQHCYWELEDLSRPSVQTDNTPSKVNLRYLPFSKIPLLSISAPFLLFTLGMHFCGLSPGTALLSPHIQLKCSRPCDSLNIRKKIFIMTLIFYVQNLIKVTWVHLLFFHIALVLVIFAQTCHHF